MTSTTNFVRIGVDVGGTNTDAVVLDPSKRAQPNRGVLAAHKVPTTHNPTQGIEQALRAVLEQSEVPTASISSVTIGTTAFLNSVIERDRARLSKVAVIRLSKSFLRDVRPFCDWPSGLADIIRGYIGYVDGGLHIDGSEEAPVVEEQVVAACREIRKLGLTAIVIAGVYSPIDTEFRQEERVRDIVRREIPGADIVCSRDVANIGFLERENASILNAAILKFAVRTIRSFQDAMKKLGLTACPLYLTQNDGTVLDAASAASIPIRTFSSGVTNSMRGAAYLSGHTSEDGNGNKPAIVVDIGGTTTDIGMLLASGIPRQASAYVSVAGVKVNYSLPHLHSIGLGGGSLVHTAPGDRVLVGPASVGNDLNKSMVFGGETMTATDIAVASGRAKVGVADAVKGIDTSVIEAAQSRIRTLLQNGIDAVKTSPEPITVLLTGGGSILAPGSLAGASTLITPPFHDVANAVGAACSKVGATIDIIQSTAQQSLAEAAEEAKRIAIERAVSAGALKESVTVAKLDVMPIPYLENQIRSVVTAIGELDMKSQRRQEVLQGEPDDNLVAPKEVSSASEPDEMLFDHANYKPKVLVNEESGVAEWHLSKVDLDYIADGCYLLGCGGGGNPEPGKLQLRDMLAAGHTVRVVDASSVKDDAVVYWGGRMGSPAAISERLQAHETVLAIRALMEFLRHDSFDAVMGLEIGGSNGMEPFLWGSSRFFDRPVIDADFMGRANPMCWQTTLTVGRPGEFTPCAIDSGDGKTMLMTRAPSDESVDKPLRAAITEMGSLVGLAPRPTTGEAAREHGVINTVSLSWRIGRAIARAEAGNTISTVAESIIEEVGGRKSAKILFRGKITAIERTLQKGLSVGVLHIAEAPAEERDESSMRAVAEGGTLRIPFINENILAEHVSDDGETTILATVPDLIALIDSQSGKPVGVPEYRYGCHVTVLGIPCSPRWSGSERGIEVGGPQGYGYDLVYSPLGQYAEPRSVVTEFLPRD